MPDNLKRGNACAASLVEVWRGPIVESRHNGHLVAVDGNGTLTASLGSPDTVTYIRSSGKPFQAIPLITSGAADRFGFNKQEIAIACGSHSGEPQHVETVRSMLRKIDLDENALQCGVHEPFNIDAARELVRKQQPPGVLQNNCSGKHAGMLALAKHLGAPIETYLEPSHPVQQSILAAVSLFARVPAGSIVIGVDGCTAPVFGISVHSMALMYARLCCPPEEFEPQLRRACERIVAAMIDFPEMVGGATDRLDTELIKAAEGRLISKIGAEGVYTVGVRPCERWPQGLGLALKIEDGDDRRARPLAVLEALRQLGIIGDVPALSSYSSIAITNRRGQPVGYARAAFELQFKKSQIT